MYVPTRGRRKPGRQRTLFTNDLLRDPDNLLNDKQLLDVNEGNVWLTALQPKDDDDDDHAPLKYCQLTVDTTYCISKGCLIP